LLYNIKKHSEGREHWDLKTKTTRKQHINYADFNDDVNDQCQKKGNKTKEGGLIGETNRS
jgi:hypothetical protein